MGDDYTGDPNVDDPFGCGVFIFWAGIAVLGFYLFG